MTATDPSPRPVWVDEVEYVRHDGPCHRDQRGTRPAELDPAHCGECRALTVRLGRPNVDRCPAARHAARQIADLHKKGARP